MVKNLPAMQETCIQSLSQEDPLEKGMTTHSSILPWRIPWTEEPSKQNAYHSVFTLRVTKNRTWLTLQFHAYEPEFCYFPAVSFWASVLTFFEPMELTPTASPNGYWMDKAAMELEPWQVGQWEEFNLKILPWLSWAAAVLAKDPRVPTLIPLQVRARLWNMLRL